MLQAGIGQISGLAEMDANSRAVGTTTTGPLSAFVPSRIQLRRHNSLLCSKKQAMFINNFSAPAFAGHLASRKLLHMDALSSIPRGLAIKMKIAQHPSIGLNYGPIGKKYWTPHPYSRSLKPLSLADRVSDTSRITRSCQWKTKSSKSIPAAEPGMRYCLDANR